MSNAVPRLTLVVYSVGGSAIPPPAERVQSSRPALAATIERAQQGNIANVPDKLFSVSP